MLNGFKVKKEDVKEESCCSVNSTQSCTSDAHSDRDNCCTPQPKGKEECPQCHDKAKGVLSKTLEHLLIHEAKKEFTNLDGFHYCKTPSCEVVYFRGNDILLQKDLTVGVGLKEGSSPETLCYCFEWSKEKIREELINKGETVALEDIKAKMENPGCSCEVLNPSGGCCLGDVTKAIKEIQKDLER